jgi:hypothetical protein
VNRRCGVFPDPNRGPWGTTWGRCWWPVGLGTCDRDRGHDPPHRATSGLYVFEWRDPEPFERLMDELKQKYGDGALRMRVERHPTAWDLGLPGPSPAGEPTVIVDKYGGTHSIMRRPIPGGWRGWRRRASYRLLAVLDAIGRAFAG